MSELTTYQQPAPIADYQSRAIDRLGAWAQSADAAFAVAQRLVQSSFVPQQFRGKPVEATAAILAGAEVGLNPMASLRAFDVIQGQAAPRALTLRAVAQSHGHDIEIVESTTTRCRVRARRRGGDWQSITWTIDRAKELGLTGKDNWRKQPQAMLVARATAEAARLVAADAILGIGYSAEEVADGASGEVPLFDGGPAEAAEQPSTGTRRMSRRRAPAPAPEPEPTEDAPTDHAENASDEFPEFPEPGITTAQIRKMGALMREAGLENRADALAYVGARIGRDVSSRNELTKDEASTVIDALEALLSPPVEAVSADEEAAQ